MTFEQFLGYLGEEMQLEQSRCHLNTTLVDLGLDSIDMYEIVLIVESFGATLSETVVGSWVTLGDVFAAVERN